MNYQQLEAKGLELKTRLANFAKDFERNPRLTEAQKQKAYESLEAEFTAWASEKERHNIGRAFTTRMGTNPGGIGTAPSNTDGLYQLGAKGLGAEVYPFALPKDELKKAFEATNHGGQYKIQAKDYSSEAKEFTSAESNLVPEMAPGITGEYFESRIIDLLPVTAISSPTYRFVQHQFASDTGGPDFVAEGATKPQWNPASAHVDVTAQKIAAYFDESTESRQDYAQWSSYLIGTLFHLISNKENSAILYGTPTDGLGIQGWSTQSGVLKHDASADPADSTNLDSLELAINQMRTVPGVYASPNIVIMSPTTWSATRRIKTTYGQYVAGDPLHEAITTVWGVPVVTTTAVNDGDAFLVDRNKFGTILVREGISTHMGYHGDGLINNILTTVAEERLTLATVIPSAVNYVTNLAVA